MNDNTINSLREALEFSPENTTLRYLLADTLLQMHRLDEAEEEYLTLIRYTNDTKAKKSLAELYFKKGNYSACNVILEEIMDKNPHEISLQILYAKGLIKENNIGKAISIYQEILHRNPDFKDEELDAQLRNRGIELTSESSENINEEYADSRFLEKPNIDFSAVGGMDTVKKEIDLKIIKPLQHADLYKAYGKKTGGGILLYGPPGCGKTFIAKATAGEVNAKFISIGLNDILDMWIGNSEKNLHEIFQLARKNAPCVVFIDEIDALGASRSDMKQSGSRGLINQFLQELDGIEHDNDGVLIVGATNAPWNLDPAFRRPGRFDRIIFIPPPDTESRSAILDIKLKNKPVGSIDVAAISKKTEHFSGADIDAIIDIAIEQKLEKAFEDGIPKPIETQDLLQGIKRHKPTTLEWFATAKNFALFANDSGLYDEILTYLKIKK